MGNSTSHATQSDTTTRTGTYTRSECSPNCTIKASHQALYLDILPSLPASPATSPEQTRSPLTPKLPSLASINAHPKKNNSPIVVQNGITGKFLSNEVCTAAAVFWTTNIDTLSSSDQLEIACSIFFGMMSTNNEMKQIMKCVVCRDNTIEKTSLKYLNMLGWLIRHLTTDNIDLYSLLYKLGKYHQNMGLKISHFTPMLKSTHDTFAYYLEDRYSIDIKDAMDEIFCFVAQIMTGEKVA